MSSIKAMGEAAVEKDERLRKQLLTFVVAGGGFSGVEVVAEINDFVRATAPDFRGRIDPKEIQEPGQGTRVESRIPGGDTNIVANFEYRIPIVGQTVTLAPFFDAGMNRISNKSQLKLATRRLRLNA